MTSKEYLRQTRMLKIGITGKYERIQQLRELSEKTTTVLTPDKISGGGEQDKISAIVSCIVDFTAEIQQETEQLVKCQRTAQRRINTLERSEHRLLLELRYFNGYSWQEIADKMSYTERHIRRMHGEALQQMGEIKE